MMNDTHIIIWIDGTTDTPAYPPNNMEWNACDRAIVIPLYYGE